MCQGFWQLFHEKECITPTWLLLRKYSAKHRSGCQHSEERKEIGAGIMTRLTPLERFLSSKYTNGWISMNPRESLWQFLTQLSLPVFCFCLNGTRPSQESWFNNNAKFSKSSLIYCFVWLMQASFHPHFASKVYSNMWTIQLDPNTRFLN